jgi:Helix-turn-helix
MHIGCITPSTPPFGSQRDIGQVGAGRHAGRMSWDSFGLDRDEVIGLGWDEVGRMVKARRQSLGLSQRQLAAVCLIDQSVLSRLECGKLRGLRWVRFARLVGVLGGLIVDRPTPMWLRERTWDFADRDRSWPGAPPSTTDVMD